MTLPVVIDRAKPKSLVVKDDQIPSASQRDRSAAEARAAEKRRGR